MHSFDIMRVFGKQDMDIPENLKIEIEKKDYNKHEKDFGFEAKSFKKGRGVHVRCYDNRPGTDQDLPEWLIFENGFVMEI